MNHFSTARVLRLERLETRSMLAAGFIKPNFDEGSFGGRDRANETGSDRPATHHQPHQRHAERTEGFRAESGRRSIEKLHRQQPDAPQLNNVNQSLELNELQPSAAPPDSRSQSVPVAFTPESPATGFALPNPALLLQPFTVATAEQVSVPDSRSSPTPVTTSLPPVNQSVPVDVAAANAEIEMEDGNATADTEEPETVEGPQADETLRDATEDTGDTTRLYPSEMPAPWQRRIEITWNGDSSTEQSHRAQAIESLSLELLFELDGSGRGSVRDDVASVAHEETTRLGLISLNSVELPFESSIQTRCRIELEMRSSIALPGFSPGETSKEVLSVEVIDQIMARLKQPVRRATEPVKDNASLVQPSRIGVSAAVAVGGAVIATRRRMRQRKSGQWMSTTPSGA